MGGVARRAARSRRRPRGRRRQRPRRRRDCVTRDAVLLSYRLGGTDGVSVEASKWGWALGELGFTVRRVAGAIAGAEHEGRDIVLPWLERDAHEPPAPAELEAALAGAVLVVVANLCSLPLNAGAARAAADVLDRMPETRVVFHHHDLPWQREQFADVTDLPPRRRGSWHVTINERSCRELAARGIEAEVIRNTFDVDAPPGAREPTRDLFGFAPDEIVVLQP